MKKRIFCLLFTTVIILSGCGSSSQIDDWNSATEFGDINIYAEEADRDDFDEVYDIDNYLVIEELNTNDKSTLSNDNYRVYYNRVAEQTGLELLYNYEVTSTQKDNTVIYDYSKGYICNYLYNNTDEHIKMIRSEMSFNTYENEEEYKQEVAKFMAPIYAGVPFLKKFDLNEIYAGMVDTFHDEKATYQTSFNGISITAKRDNWWVYIDIKIN